jgi:hypothetical protein
MSATPNDRGATDAQDGRPDWLTFQPTDFNAGLPLTQGALFSKPDPMGTPALFGDAYGSDL